MSVTVREPRAWCAACRRARVGCYCAVLAPFDIGFELALCVHPKEARVAIGTGRIVHRLVRGSHLVVGAALDDDARVRTLLARADLAPAILFPREGAVDLDGPSAPVEALFAGRRPLVIVVDGTWSTAKKVLRLSPRLATLPALRFAPATPSRYGRLRKEPRAECWSTLEAAHCVIDRLAAHGVAPAPAARAHDRMLALMDEVVARQLAFEPLHHADAMRGVRTGS